MIERTLYQQIIDDFIDSIERNGLISPPILKDLQERLSEEKKLLDWKELISLLKSEE
ncbi:unnamed protein product [marine sediment metagenome]|uniref:Uncharacterized protein n=1 Tax=marine sediment metagenome TaxID=412755 RepID=X1NQF1_9ZZZZ